MAEMFEVTPDLARALESETRPFKLTEMERFTRAWNEGPKRLHEQTCGTDLRGQLMQAKARYRVTQIQGSAIGFLKRRVTLGTGERFVRIMVAGCGRPGLRKTVVAAAADEKDEDFVVHSCQPGTFLKCKVGLDRAVLEPGATGRYEVLHAASWRVLEWGDAFGLAGAKDGMAEMQRASAQIQATRDSEGLEVKGKGKKAGSPSRPKRPSVVDSPQPMQKAAAKKPASPRGGKAPRR